MRKNRLPQQSRSTSNSGKGDKRRRAIFSAVEHLEVRQMFSTAPVLGGDGLLYVPGTTGNDQITVAKDPTNSADIRVTVNGTSHDYPAAKVDLVKVDGAQGNDAIKLDESHGAVAVGMYFLGGAGSDTLVSGTHNDALLGGGENDVLFTRGGNNLLSGGDGEDKLFAGSGNDTLQGDGGNDQITDSGGTNTVVGVSRGDIVTKAALPSTIPTAVGSTSTPTPAPAPTPAPTAGTPAAPTNVSATATSSTSIQVSWTDNANNETGYKIDRSTDGTNFYPVLGTGANGTRVTDTGVSAGKRYYYRVYAINGAGRSANSAVVTAVPGSTSTPVPAPLPEGPTQVSTSPFVIGVWSQPAWSMDKWKGRGINTMVGYESLSGTVSNEAWSSAAVSKGLYMIRQANATASKDVGQKNLLAWMLNDEPDYHNTPYQTPLNQYNALKAVDRNRPVFENFSGSSALWHYGNWGEADYKNYLKSADWVSNDLYPVTAHNRPWALDAPGQAVATLANWSGGKRQFAVLEASDQQLPGVQYAYPGVNADQFRAEVFNSIISGATGIIYFPQRIGGGFNFDAMNSTVAAEMTKTNGRISRIGAALMTQKDPSGVSMDVDGALRVTWRKYNGKTYFVVLNNSNATVSASMDVHGVSASSAAVDGENRTVAIRSGVIGDTFKPYEAHVYVVG
jgi:hypothetical protein